MNAYTYDNYLSLISYITEQYEFQISEINNIVHEFINDEIPVLCLIYDEHNGDIIVSFHVAIISLESIPIMDTIKSMYKLVKLGESYFIDNNEIMVFGENARQCILNSIKDGIKQEIYTECPDEYNPDHPVSYIVNTILYSADHPNAKIEYEKYIKNIRYRQGKII